MKAALAAIRKIKLPDLPTLGIFAFALASTWALFQFFNNKAIHPTWLYWIPAALCEIVTAWLTKHAVEAVYQLTRSNLSQQDKRFFKIVTVVTVLLVLPTFAASIQANLYEFDGAWALALLFPVAVIGCAIGAQIPRSVKQHVAAKDDESRAELRKVRRELRESRAAYNRAHAELGQIENKHEQEIVQVRAELAQRAQMKDPSRAALAQIVAENGNTPPTTAREVNRMLNDNGYYAAPDRTAASWIARK